nr:MAG TPA: hypothetical protein [Caudoviricetes sp.]
MMWRTPPKAFIEGKKKFPSDPQRLRGVTL